MSGAREIVARARALGDDVNTDYIISSSRKKETIDPQALKRFLFETIAPGLAEELTADDVIVAGSNFGCGSAMEVAVTALAAATAPVVLARSFARTYFRNAINNGLLPIVCDTSGIADGARITVRLSADGIAVETEDGTIPADPYPAFVLEIVEAGGLAPYIRANGTLPGAHAA